jgi:hypothetical protein
LKPQTFSPGAEVNSTGIEMFLLPGEPEAEPIVSVAAWRLDVRINIVSAVM